VQGHAIDVYVTPTAPMQLRPGPKCQRGPFVNGIKYECSMKGCKGEKPANNKSDKPVNQAAQVLDEICNPDTGLCTVPPGSSISNTALWALGCSYGVIKHTGDEPHWSVEGGS
jgi:hypothetical protein